MSNVLVSMKLRALRRRGLRTGGLLICSRALRFRSTVSGETELLAEHEQMSAVGQKLIKAISEYPFRELCSTPPKKATPATSPTPGSTYVRSEVIIPPRLNTLLSRGTQGGSMGGSSVPDQILSRLFRDQLAVKTGGKQDYLARHSIC